MASFKLPAWGSDYYTVFLSQAPNSCNLSIVPYYVPSGTTQWDY